MIKFRMRSHFSQLLPAVSLITIFGVSSWPSVAQIVPDNTLGTEGSVVTPNVNLRNIPSERIDGGAVRGSNLFHSFQEFNVEVGRGVYFSNPDSIVNILTRVTGDKISNILGTLGVLGNANLFLINPNGIVFGPNARLDVGGSFFASTADGIFFENGVEFAASNPEAPPLLTINIPLGLNIRENPGTIVNQATLTTLEDGSTLRDNNGFLIPQGLNVPRNQTLALVGGDVIFDNAIAISPGSNIELGGLSQPGIVQLNSDGSLTFPTNTQRSNIALTNESQINVRSDGGGNVNINARNLEISGGSIIRAGIDQGLGSPEATSGDVNINAQESILMTGEESSIRNAIDIDGMGQMGNVNLTTKRLTIEESAFINSLLLGQGNGGSISVLATESVNLSNSRINSSLDENIVGEVGDIKITTPLLNGINGQIDVRTFWNGNTGNIQLEAQQINLSDFIVAAETFGVGNVGNIIINTGSLAVRDGTDIRLDVGEGATGSTGNIIVNASEKIEISGVAPEASIFIRDPETLLETKISSRIKTSTDGRGNAGSIFINTPRLMVRNGGTIFANSFSNGRAGSVIINASESVEVSGFSMQPDGSLTSSDISTSSPPVFVEDIRSEGGSASDVVITTGKLTIRDGSSVSASTSFGQGDAGSVLIRANQIEVIGSRPSSLSERGFIPSSIDVTASFGGGNAGTLTIDTEQLVVQGGATISTSNAGSGSTSDINIRANVIELAGTSPDNIAPSQIVTRVQDSSDVDDSGLIEVGTGNSGNINIVTQQLRLQNGAQVTTTTFSGQGNSGNITVQAADIELIGASAPLEGGISLWPSGFSSLSGVGNAGNITIETERLVVRDGAGISAATLGTGNAGEINIQAQHIELIGINRFPTGFSQSGLFSFTSGSGNAGRITIETDQLMIQEGGLISARVENTTTDEDSETPQLTSGSGGTIIIRASEAVDLSGVGFRDDQVRLSSISSSTSENTIGDGGSVRIETGRLTLQDGAEISASTSGDGNAGSVEIQARNIEVTGTARDGELSSRLSAEVTESAIGEGGTVNVNAQQLTVREGANLTVSSRGQGNPGNLQVNVNNIRLDTQGRLTAESATGQGGNIGIRSTDMRLRRQSEISATGSETGITEEGNITIETNLLVLLEGSRILTSAFDPAGGSNITIRPFGGSELAVIQSNTSIINAAGDLSIDTTLNFDPPDVSEVTVVDPAALIAQDPCKQRGDSEFIITGRGGIASSPNNIFTGDRTQVNLVEPVRSSQNRSILTQSARTELNQPRSSADIVPARGWIRDENGDVILVSYDPTKTGVRRQLQNSNYCDQ